jgi:hypothetical protein
MITLFVYSPAIPDTNAADNEIDSFIGEKSVGSSAGRRRREATENDSSIALEDSKEQDNIKPFPYDQVAQGEHFGLIRKSALSFCIQKLELELVCALLSSVSGFWPAIVILKFFSLISVDAGMKLLEEVWANETSLDGRKRTIFFLRNLTHFTMYTIGIRACRTVSPSIENDTRYCSEMVKNSETTLPSGNS